MYCYIKSDKWLPYCIILKPKDHKHIFSLSSLEPEHLYKVIEVYNNGASVKIEIGKNVFGSARIEDLVLISDDDALVKSL